MTGSKKWKIRLLFSKKVKVDLAVPNQVLHQAVLVGLVCVVHDLCPDHGRDPCPPEDGAAGAATDAC